jgi:transcriptional regulator GlxA family with amidase domain
LVFQDVRIAWAFLRLAPRARRNTKGSNPFPMTPPKGARVPNDDKMRTIAFVAYPGLTLLDVVGPMTAFMGLTRGLVSTSREYSTVLVAERVEPVDSDTPMALIPDKAFEEVPDPFGIIVPGGGVHALKAMGNERLINYLRFASYGAELIGSVSTGGFLLAAAGLLEGQRATTHPSYADLLEKLGANYVPRNWVEDGRFFTAAGVSGGIDMALYLVARLKNEQQAKSIQTAMEYDPDPPFGGLEQNGGAGGNGLATALAEDRSDLERALADRPDLYQKLFG